MILSKRDVLQSYALGKKHNLIHNDVATPYPYITFITKATGYRGSTILEEGTIMALNVNKEPIPFNKEAVELRHIDYSREDESVAMRKIITRRVSKDLKKYTKVKGIRISFHLSARGLLLILNVPKKRSKRKKLKPKRLMKIVKNSILKIVREIYEEENAYIVLQNQYEDIHTLSAYVVYKDTIEANEHVITIKGPLYEINKTFEKWW